MDLLAELRRRLDVPAGAVSDELLTHMLTVAENALAPYLVDDPTPWQANVDEGTVELAVKLWAVMARGVDGLDQTGEWIMPAPAATPGLIRAVMGALGPALKTGGVSV